MSPPKSVQWVPLSETSDSASSPARKFIMLPLLVYRLIRQIKMLNIDLVYSGLFRANIVAVIANWVARRPTVISVHSVYSQTHAGQPIKKFLTKHLYPKADAVIFVSRYAQQDLMETLGVQATNPQVIPNFLNEERFSEEGSRPGAGQASAGPLIASVGRLVPEKNFETLIRAHKHVNESEPAARLVIVGEGSQRERLEALITELDLENHVSLVGQTPHPDHFVRDADLYVQPSVYETFGIAALEAMYLGVPAILSNIQAFDDLSQSGTAAELVDASAPELLGEAILNLLSNSSKREKLASSGRLRALEFRQETVVPKHLALVHSLLRSRP